MTLQDCLELGKECGLSTLDECVRNVEIHSSSLFKYDNHGTCEHEDHIIDTPEDREICEDFVDFEKWWNSLDDIEREEYNRFMEEL